MGRVARLSKFALARKAGARSTLGSCGSYIVIPTACRSGVPDRGYLRIKQPSIERGYNGTRRMDSATTNPCTAGASLPEVRRSSHGLDLVLVDEFQDHESLRLLFFSN